MNNFMGGSAAGREVKSTGPCWLSSRSYGALLLVLLTTFTSLALAGKPAGVGSEKPTPNGSTQLLPQRLGLPAGCSGTEGYGLNDRALPNDLVIVGMAWCSENRAMRWQAGQWSDVFTGPTNSIANDVSNDSPGLPEGQPTLTGFALGSGYFEFAQRNGAPAVALTRLPGTVDVIGARLRISDDGRYVTGFLNGNANGELYGVRWHYDNGAWLPQALGLDFDARGISDDGSVIAGSTNGVAQLWLDSPGTDGLYVTLGPGYVLDMTADASFVVGYRMAPCSGSCTWFPVPVFWRQNGNTWERHDLVALDGVDSKATGIANVSGKLMIVGWGYTRKDATMRAVAWIPAADGSYGAPVRLAAIDGRSKSFARAVAVNRHGVVLGQSGLPGWNQEAVYWILPQ